MTLLQGSLHSRLTSIPIGREDTENKEPSTLEGGITHVGRVHLWRTGTIATQEGQPSHRVGSLHTNVHSDKHQQGLAIAHTSFLAPSVPPLTHQD